MPREKSIERIADQRSEKAFEDIRDERRIPEKNTEIGRIESELLSHGLPPQTRRRIAMIVRSSLNLLEPVKSISPLTMA